MKNLMNKIVTKAQNMADKAKEMAFHGYLKLQQMKVKTGRPPWFCRKSMGL